MDRAAAMSNDLPGKGLFGWLGRQIGYVKKAVQTNVAGPQKIYRNETVEEQPHPADPRVRLRRTTIDEAIVDRSTSSQSGERSDDADKH